MCRAARGLPPPSGGWSPPWSPAGDDSPRAAMQAPEPPTLALLYPFSFKANPGKAAQCSRASLAWEMLQWAKEEEWRMLCCSHSGIGRCLTLVLQKPVGSLHRCWLCSPKQVSDGQKDLFLKGLPHSRSQGKRTQAQIAQHKSLGSLNTSGFDPKCAFLNVNRGDQHVLCLLTWLLLDLQTFQSPWACSAVVHAAFGALQAHQFSLTQILTLEWRFAPGYCPQTIICQKTNKRRTLKILLYDTFLISENVR